MVMRLIIGRLLLNGYPTQILLIQFLRNGILYARIVRLILIPQTVDVEYIIPQKVLTFDMHIEILILLISLRPRHPTNKAQCLHILYNLFLPVTQFSKRIDHNTRDNITEEEFHHHNVD